MMNKILEKLKTNNFKDLSGSHLTVSLPVSKEVLTLFFNSAENDMIEGFRIREMHADHFLLDLKPRNYRQMRIKGVIQPQVAFDESGKPQLQIKILDGINILEKGAILLFSNKLPDTIDMTPSRLTIHLNRVLAQMDMAYLAPFIHWKSIEAKEGQAIFNFDIKI